VAVMISTLVEGHATVNEIAEVSGLSPQSVRGYVTAMRKQKALHVAAWEFDAAGRRRVASYALGEKRDAPKPEQRSRAELVRAYRSRQRDARMLGLR
jgi:predicted transcriptional regulator